MKTARHSSYNSLGDTFSNITQTAIYQRIGPQVYPAQSPLCILKTPFLNTTII